MADFTILGLFSGIGGLEAGVAAGLRDVGLSPRVVGMVEGEAFGSAVLARSHEPLGLACPPQWMGDVREFPASAFRGAVDCVVAGFPCQPASTAGARRGTDDERWLWPEVVRVLRDVGPRYVVLENVRGLLSVDDGRAFGSVLSDLADLGFDAEWSVFSAEAVGAPHRRERVFILGRNVGDAADDHGRAGDRGEEEGTWPAGQRRRGLASAGGELGDAGAWPLRWPPLPGDRDAWARVLAGDPGLAPALADAGRERGRQWRESGPGLVADAPERCEARHLDQHGIAGVADSDSGRRELGREPQRADVKGAPVRESDGCGDDGELDGADGDGGAALADLRRVDDGLPTRANRPLDVDRTDRLRALGNAVVRSQARHAVRGLWRWIHG